MCDRSSGSSRLVRHTAVRKERGLGVGVLPEASASFTRHARKCRKNSWTLSSQARRRPARCGRRSVRTFFKGVGAASSTSMASPPPRAAPDLAGATASTPVVAVDAGSDAQPPAVVVVPLIWDVAAAVSAPAVAEGSRGAAPTAGGAAPPVPPAVAGSSLGGGDDSCHGLRTRWYRKPGGRGGSGGNVAVSPSADFEGGESGMVACRVARRTAQRQQWTQRPSTEKKGRMHRRCGTGRKKRARSTYTSTRAVPASEQPNAQDLSRRTFLVAPILPANEDCGTAPRGPPRRTRNGATGPQECAGPQNRRSRTA